MPGLYRDAGVVLRTIKLGEADRIVTLATASHGKVRAVAKGVRKTKSRFGSRLEPISHVDVLLYAGRELDVVTSTESIDHFKAVRDDLDRLTRATALLEAVDAVIQEGEKDPRIYQMLVGALRTLAAGEAPLIVPAFYWKLLAQQGVGPVLDRCASCGTNGPLVAFDLGEGGTLCRACRRGVPISPEALGLLRRILGGDLLAVLAEGPSPDGWEVEALATAALEHHLERRLRAVHILDHH
ncbi:MAG: DNA repair protein RecO [Actinomycetota bacterium]|nr:DNA repair protein RecO [Actinomycetota bacterium]